MNNAKALVIQPDLTFAIHEVDGESPDAVRALIGGGWLEGVGPVSVGRWGLWHAYCDEEGKLRKLPLNPLATRLAHFNGWPRGDVLVGPVAFFGNGRDGAEADVPDGLVEDARSLAAAYDDAFKESRSREPGGTEVPE